jgi:hypothetical protein
LKKEHVLETAAKKGKSENAQEFPIFLCVKKKTCMSEENNAATYTQMEREATSSLSALLTGQGANSAQQQQQQQQQQLVEPAALPPAPQVEQAQVQNAVNIEAAATPEKPAVGGLASSTAATNIAAAEANASSSNALAASGNGIVEGALGVAVVPGGVGVVGGAVTSVTAAQEQAEAKKLAEQAERRRKNNAMPTQDREKKTRKDEWFVNEAQLVCTAGEFVAVRATPLFEGDTTVFWLAHTNEALTNEIGTTAHVEYLTNAHSGYEGAYEFAGAEGEINEPCVLATEVELTRVKPNLFLLAHSERQAILDAKRTLDGHGSVIDAEYKRSYTGTQPDLTVKPTRKRKTIGDPEDDDEFDAAEEDDADEELMLDDDKGADKPLRKKKPKQQPVSAVDDGEQPQPGGVATAETNESKQAAKRQRIAGNILPAQQTMSASLDALLPTADGAPAAHLQIAPQQQQRPAALPIGPPPSAQQSQQAQQQQQPGAINVLPPVLQPASLPLGAASTAPAPVQFVAPLQASHQPPQQRPALP